MNLIPNDQKTGSGPNLGLGGMKSQGISIYGRRQGLDLFGDKKILFSFLAIVLALAAWGGVKVYGFFVLEKELASLSDQIIQVESGVKSDEVKTLVDLDRTIILAEDLLKRHIYSSEFFALIQDVTLPMVQWDDLLLTPEEGKAELSGKTVSFSMLAKQIVSFESSDFKAEISNISIGENGIEFSAALNFDPALLLRQ